jgi:hypothetical protein
MQDKKYVKNKRISRIRAILGRKRTGARNRNRNKNKSGGGIRIKSAREKRARARHGPLTYIEGPMSIK